MSAQPQGLSEPGGEIDIAAVERVEPGQREATGPRRASIAIMPFVDLEAGREGKIPLARGLSHDLITRLAKLRSVFVIAQGTVFALAEKGVSAEEAGRLLNVDYVASGTLRNRDGHVSVAVELVETRCARIIWADTIERKLSDSLSIEDTVVNEVVSAIASEIELTERNRAILKPPGSLDAWEALHCGFWHMYRFNEADNERAKRFFKLAVRPRSDDGAGLCRPPSRISRTRSRCASASGSRRSRAL